MKVKILKKSIKEGDTIDGRHYSIKSLFVSFTDSTLYSKIVANLKAQGCSDEAIERFCKPSEYKGETSYCFGFNASNFTFERVEQFGILDANFIFSQNEKGFIDAKIQVVDRKEQVNGYEPPKQMEEEVDGWSLPGEDKPETNSLNPTDADDLPF